MVDPNFPFPPPAVHKDELRGRGPPIGLALTLAAVLVALLVEGLSDERGRPSPELDAHGSVPEVEDPVPRPGDSVGEAEHPLTEVEEDADPPIDTPRDRIVLDGQRIAVPVEDLAYGRSPAQPIPPGSYELVLANYGTRQHTLVNDALGVDLHADAALMGRDVTVAGTRVRLTPGTYTFYCRIPGHREQGDLVVGEAER